MITDLQIADQPDPLRHCREAFDLPDGILYMNGNSLGPLPHAARDAVAKAVSDEWGKGLIRSWNTADWYSLPSTTGAKIAPLIGAKAHEVICADTVSINIFKLAAAAVKMRPGRHVILTEAGNFPTDGYMLDGLADMLGKPFEVRRVAREDIEEHLTEEVALLLLTHVHYVSGAMFDMAAMSTAAHTVGALTLWDLSHSTGAVPVALRQSGADFAVGCGYKYLNGGPGAPAFLYVSHEHLNALQQPLTGWFSHSAPFAFEDSYTPAADMRKCLTGTTGVLGMVALSAALDVWHGVNIIEVRKKSVDLSTLFIDLFESELAHHGFQLVTPRTQAERGSHVTFTHTNGYAIMQACIDAGVIGDFRAPNALRFGFAPLYQSYADIAVAVDRIKEVMEQSRWRHPDYQQKGAVT